MPTPDTTCLQCRFFSVPSPAELAARLRRDLEEANGKAADSIPRAFGSLGASVTHAAALLDGFCSERCRLAHRDQVARHDLRQLVVLAVLASPTDAASIVVN